MKDPRQLRETSWRRPLTASEESELRAWLAAHPEAREDHELDAALTESLRRLPDVLVSSNFTARVLKAVELEAAPSRRDSRSRWKTAWHSWVPRIAFGAAGVLTIVAGFTVFRHHERVQARQMAQSVSAVSQVASLPSPEVLQDFDVIRNLNPSPAPDETLLALFQ